MAPGITCYNPASMRRLARTGAVLLGAFVFAACRPAKYVRYASSAGDFTCDVPWGWSVIVDSAGSDYTNVTFTGPIEPSFYRGVPSFSVRWYRAGAPHRLPDGSYETYANHEDFVRQMLSEVYTPGGKMWGGADAEIGEALAKRE